MMINSDPSDRSRSVASRPNDVASILRLHQCDLAKRWRISPRTLERWRVEGRGPAYLKIGGRVVYRLEDIEAYEAAQLHRPERELRLQPGGA